MELHDFFPVASFKRNVITNSSDRTVVEIMATFKSNGSTVKGVFTFLMYNLQCGLRDLGKCHHVRYLYLYYVLISSNPALLRSGEDTAIALEDVEVATEKNGDEDLDRAAMMVGKHFEESTYINRHPKRKNYEIMSIFVQSNLLRIW